MNGKNILFVGIGLGISIIGILFSFYGYENTWKLWGIQTMYPYFADLRTITGGAESWALGYDPLVNNPGDPGGRLMNYPRVWQMLFRAGIGQADTIYFGIAFALLFFAGIFLCIPANIDNVSAILLLLSIFSPAVLLGLERGNNDLFIFFLLAVTIALLNKDSTYLKAIAIVSALFAFILKLFPIFAFVFMVKERKSTLVKLGCIVLAIAAAYLMLTYEDLVMIRQGTQRDRATDFSYGIDVFWMSINEYSPTQGSIAKVATYLAVFIGLFLLLLGFFTKASKPAPPENTHGSQKRIDAFRSGSAIYIGTFILGSNYDYRLIFLLFTIPHLVFLSTTSANSVSRVAKIVIISILVSMWNMVLLNAPPYMAVVIILSFFLDQLAKWVVFFGLAYLISCSMPAWIKKGFASMFSH